MPEVRREAALTGGVDFVASGLEGFRSVSSSEPRGTVVSVRVCNAGSEAGETTFVVDVIGASGAFPLAGGSTGLLGPGQCVLRELVVRPQSAPEGILRPRLTVDPEERVAELSEANNSLTGARLGVGAWPDPAAAFVTVSPHAPPDGRASARSIDCNLGTTATDATIMTYVSRDRVWSPDDQGLAQSGLYGLAPGQCRTSVLEIDLRSRGLFLPGTYFLIDRVERSSGQQADTSNDVAVSTPLVIGRHTDFTVKRFSAPVAVEPDVPFSAEVEVCNHGSAGGRARVALHASLGATVTRQDTAVGSVDVGLIDPRQCLTRTLTASIQAGAPGHWLMAAFVAASDGQVEYSEADNASTVLPVGVGLGASFTLARVNAPASARPGAPVAVEVEVCNAGPVPGMPEVEVLLSADDVLTAQDGRVAGAVLQELAPGACGVRSLSVTAPPREEVWYLGARVGAAGRMDGLDTGHTLKLSGPLAVGLKPDLVVTRMESPEVGVLRSGINTTVTVCNQGTAGARAEVLLVLSWDTVITPADDAVGGGDLGFLDAGQCVTRALLARHLGGPWGGLVRLGAIADVAGNWEELREGNNATASGPLAEGVVPEVYITQVSAPERIRVGQPFTVVFTVCNRGYNISRVPTNLLLSQDGHITRDDRLVGFGESAEGLVVPGQCETIQATATATTVPPGEWFIGALLDESRFPHSDAHRDNDAMAGNRLVLSP